MARVLEPARNIWQRYVTFPVAFAAFGCVLVISLVEFFSSLLGCRDKVKSFDVFCRLCDVMCWYYKIFERTERR